MTSKLSSGSDSLLPVKELDTGRLEITSQKEEPVVKSVLPDALAFYSQEPSIEYGEVVDTSWIDGTGPNSLRNLEQRWQTEGFFTSVTSLSESTWSGVFDIYVEVGLLSDIQLSLNTYVTDLTSEGYQVTVQPFSSSAEQLRSQLQSRWLNNNLEGALFIGDLPHVDFTSEDNFGGTGSQVTYPHDLYFMDLDGNYDLASVGLDQHTGDVGPEIYVSRLTTGNLSGVTGKDEVTLINDYFAKNHAYRTGQLTFNNGGIVFADDDWRYWGTEQMQDLYSEVLAINDPVETNKTTYLNTLKLNCESILECIHSSSTGHSLGGGWISNSEIAATNPRIGFYNMFNCSSANFTVSNNLIGTYVYSGDYGLNAVGSTKTGSMLYFPDYYRPQGNADSVGQAFLQWFDLWAAATDDPFADWKVDWFYGMTMQGDPTLKPALMGGDWQNTKIHGSKWNDLNQNGLWDTGEPALADWTIYLDSNNNGQLDEGERSTVTDVNGEYTFEFLQAGTYTVAEVVQPGWVQTYPSSSEPHTVEVEGGEVIPGINFGNFLANPAEIHGYKWNDLNGDGIWNAGESGLEGWTIYLDENQNGQFDGGEPFDITDPAGEYSFTNLAPDTYVVAEMLQEGWEQTYPSSRVLEDFEDGNIEEYQEIRSPGASVATIAARDGTYGLLDSVGGGWLYRDDPQIFVQQGDTISVWINLADAADGRAYFGFGASETGTLSAVLAPNTEQLIIQENKEYRYNSIAAVSQTYTPNQWYKLEVDWGVGGNITAQLFDSDGTTLLNSVTGYSNMFTSGSIAFRGTHSDKYFDTITLENSNVFRQTVELEPDEIATDINFGNHLPLGEIHGKVWSDLNGDGEPNTGEPGLRNCIVYLDENHNSQHDPGEVSTQTDIYGNYAFTDLAPGTYAVAEVIQPSWHQTCPGWLNSGFEMGDFTSWQILGNTSIESNSFGSGPTEGTYQALVTNGSGSVSDTEIENFLELTPGSLDGLGNGDATSGAAIARLLTVSAGDQVSFDWNFLTDEFTPDWTYNDFAFVSIVPIVSDSFDTLADTYSTFVSSPTDFNEETGFETFYYTFPTDGMFTLGVGVVDVEDEVVDSGLLVDNFSFTGEVSSHHMVELAPGDIATDIDFGNHQLESPTTIYLTKGNDVRTIVDSPVIVYALRGNDEVDGSGSEGGNRFYGGHGKDILTGNFCDQLFGGPGDDEIIVTNGAGNNTLFGEGDNDILRAGLNDWLDGGTGDDILYAGQQDTTMTGDQGNDEFWITQGNLPGTPHAIADFEDMTDKLGVGGFNENDVNILESNRGTLIQISGTDTAILTGVSANLIDLNDFIFA